MGVKPHERALAANVTAATESRLVDLVPFAAGDRVFAVQADQVDGTAEAKTPAALPNAPPAVMGVVCVRGRMLTILDPLVLAGVEAAPNRSRTIPCVLALRGDEQLGLAAQSFLETITIAAVDIEEYDQGTVESPQAVLGIARHGGQEITVLKVNNLFNAAFRRKERRRRRF